VPLDKIIIMTVTCSACSHKFDHVEIGKGLMKCPKCKAEYVLVEGTWHDKRFQDYLKANKLKT
jgi:ribosomal protein L37AE/L43A